MELIREPDFLCCGQKRYSCKVKPGCGFDHYDLDVIAAHEAAHVQEKHTVQQIHPSMTLFDFKGDLL